MIVDKLEGLFSLLTDLVMASSLALSAPPPPSQARNRMSISRYIVVAVARCSCDCSRLPVRRWSLPRPGWQWATSGRLPS
jgi:hypothetical protein